MSLRLREGRGRQQEESLARPHPQLRLSTSGLNEEFATWHSYRGTPGPRLRRGAGMSVSGLPTLTTLRGGPSCPVHSGLSTHCVRSATGAGSYDQQRVSTTSFPGLSAPTGSLTARTFRHCATSATTRRGRRIRRRFKSGRDSRPGAVKISERQSLKTTPPLLRTKMLKNHKNENGRKQ